MIKTTYLKIGSADASRHQRTSAAAGLSVVPTRNPRHCAALYAEVGKAYYWDIYRVGWTSVDWDDYLRQPDVEVSRIRTARDVVGYLELKRWGDAMEIVNFGLRPAHIGQGLGKLALEAALSHGFASGVSEIWLHTCSLDHPAALKNYYARGFQFVKEHVDNFLPLDPLPGRARLAA